MSLQPESPPTLVLATRNRGKVSEMRALLAGTRIRVLGLRDFPNIPETVEDGVTLEENALKKARDAFQATGFPSLSDDSGLEIAALDGRPGVYSARYAGPNPTYADNNRKVLHELKGIPAAERKARFRCVMAFVTVDSEMLGEGTCPGYIAESSRGTGGFGYDPIFLPEGFDLSFAELPESTKNRISHRAHAFLSILPRLNACFA